VLTVLKIAIFERRSKE